MVMLNNYTIKGNVVEIEAFYKGEERYTVVIDADSFDEVDSINGHWSIAKQGSMMYVRGRLNNKQIWLHRFLMGKVPHDKLVDHKDKDTMNHRMSNLRVTTRRANAWNTDRLTKHGERCIQQTPSGKYRVRVGMGSKDIKHVGTFATMDEAITARDKFLFEMKL
jgi:hypothetical protein